MSNAIDNQNAGGTSTASKGHGDTPQSASTPTTAPISDQGQNDTDTEADESKRCGGKSLFDVVTKIIEIAVGIFVGAALVSLSYCQYTVYRQQATIMQSDHQPWVSAFPVSLTKDLIHDDGGLVVTLTFPLKNTGHSPAKRVYPAFITSLIPIIGDPIRRASCDKADTKILGISIFPGDTISQDITERIPETEFQDFKIGKITNPFPQIMACIIYYDMDTPERHSTPYVFVLTPLADPSGSPMPLIQKHGTIRKKSLLLKYEPVDASPN